ncbi:hypothetical protein FACS1894199_17130 [Bacteroidia bacterium]|nr:hypothetical protein FACS1894199_17130 [Bacteroidia bacterium]
METLATAVNAGHVYADTFFFLTTDLTNSSDALTSVIGDNQSTPFCGTFDGRGHTLLVNINSDMSHYFAGVFGILINAKVRNLCVSGSVSSYYYSGGICGYASNSSISNCYNVASISSVSSTVIPCAGGICGAMSGGDISNSYNRGNISSSTVSPCGGGICGSLNGGNISNCFATNASLTTTGNFVSPGRIVGRIDENGTLSNNYALSSMRVNSATASSTDANGKDGSDMPLSSFQRQSWFDDRNMDWDFEDIWAMPSNTSINSGLPIFQSVSNDSSGTNPINFYPNGGSGTMTSGTKIYGTPLSLPPNGFTAPAHKHFIGWAESLSGEVRYKAGELYTRDKSIDLYAVWELDSYPAVTEESTDGGSISPSPPNVTHGKDVQYTIVPEYGYEIDKVMVDDGTTQTDVTEGVIAADGIYTIDSVIAPLPKIIVSFKLKQYTITLPTAVENGSLSPSTAQTVKHGENSMTFTFTPNTGYSIGHVWLDGVDITREIVDNSYTLIDVTSDHTISVTFTEFLPNIIVQIWDDVLSVIALPKNNGGYTFKAYQWQKDNQDIPDQTGGYIYLTGKMKDYEAEYSVVVTLDNGQERKSTPFKLQVVSRAVKSYPNPTSDVLTLESATLQTGDKVELYDLSGQLLYQFAAQGNQTRVDLSPFPPGIYILKINNEAVKVLKNSAE